MIPKKGKKSAAYLKCQTNFDICAKKCTTLHHTKQEKELKTNRNCKAQHFIRYDSYTKRKTRPSKKYEKKIRARKKKEWKIKQKQEKGAIRYLSVNFAHNF